MKLKLKLKAVITQTQRIQRNGAIDKLIIDRIDLIQVFLDFLRFWGRCCLRWAAELAEHRFERGRSRWSRSTGGGTVGTVRAGNFFFFLAAEKTWNFFRISEKIKKIIQRKRNWLKKYFFDMLNKIKFIFTCYFPIKLKKILNFKIWKKNVFLFLFFF